MQLRVANVPPLNLLRIRTGIKNVYRILEVGADLCRDLPRYSVDLQLARLLCDAGSLLGPLMHCQLRKVRAMSIWCICEYPGLG